MFPVIRNWFLAIGFVFGGGFLVAKVENFDFGWKFHAGEVEGAEAVDFDDAGWRDVDLPHDWSIEGEFSKEHPSFSRGAWVQTGKVVYRKTFEVPAEAEGQRYVIYFGGAYRNSEVFLNGQLLGKRPLGYISFHYDLTEHLNFGGENVVTVKLDNSSQPGSRWYTGTGIYRHVKLITSGKLFVPVWGNRIVADDYTDKSAEVKLETTVRNDFEEARELVIRHKAFEPGGTLSATVEGALTLEAGEEQMMNLRLDVPNPQIWSQETPNLYEVVTELLVDGVVVYSEKETTGIRRLEFSAAEGFKLNGEVVKLKGVCLHHAGGPIGAAIYPRTTERQLEILREMGCNAIRTAHNPFSEEFLDVCDRMGFLVMNEMFDEWEIVKEPATTQNGKKIRIPVDYYAGIFQEWADRDLRDFVLRDRNHPSVIMWSIGNEIDQMHEEEGAHIGKRLGDIVRELDDRPITNGVNGYGWDKYPNDEAVATSDIIGYNYIFQKGFDREWEIHSDRMTVVTEHQSAQAFYPRSTYLYGKAEKEFWDKLGYEELDAREWVESRGLVGPKGVDAWRLVKERPHVMGIFIWTGWDYLGEVIPWGWPARSSCFAPIDLCGFPKDGYYFYQSQWTEEPMVHVFPHWNLEGATGEPVQVYTYTNGDEVELYQDGKLVGKQSNDREGVRYQVWDLVYQPGELKAVSYRDGKVVAEKVVKTVGEPAKIEVTTRRAEMKANGQDLIYVECTILDKDGNEVPTANNMLKFDLEGPAVIAGIGNGDSMGLEPFHANPRSAFHGKSLAILKSTQEAGVITCTVSGEGLETAVIDLKAVTP
ncbi:MAG: glycoside hydrolase family 2 TIM barrel-domain containing protein [Verrucomicrobiota bacterium]